MYEERTRRRAFIARLVRLFFGIFSLISVVSAFRLKPGAPERVVSLEARPVRIASLAELQQKGYLAFNLRGRPGILLLTGEEIRAFDATCTHMGCPVSGRSLKEKQVLECPCHGSTYDPATGARLSGPAPRGLKALPFEVRGGEIYVLPLQA
jgi:Rieske Fe-S protein